MSKTIRCRVLIFGRDIGWGRGGGGGGAMSWCDLGATLIFCLCQNVSTAIFKTYFSCHKNIWIAAIDYYMFFYLIVLCPITTIIQFINIIAS